MVALESPLDDKHAENMWKERWEQLEPLISSPSPEFPWLQVGGRTGTHYTQSAKMI